MKAVIVYPRNQPAQVWRLPSPRNGAVHGIEASLHRHNAFQSAVNEPLVQFCLLKSMDSRIREALFRV